MLSNSSMKTMQGRCLPAFLKRERILRAPSDMKALWKSAPLVAMKFTPASWASALAKSVLPLPGGPSSTTPFTWRTPRPLQAAPSLSRPTTWRISRLRASMPAMSSNVTPVLRTTLKVLRL